MANETTPLKITWLGLQQEQALRSYLRDLCFAVGARDALIADLSGHLWLTLGPDGEYDRETFTVLLATGMGAVVEMMNVLDDSQGTSFFLHEGAKFVFTSAHIDQDMVFALIFEQGRVHSRIGSVYFYLKRAVEELRHLLKSQGTSPSTSLAQHAGQKLPADVVNVSGQLALAAPSGLNLPPAADGASIGGPTLLSYQEALSLGLVDLGQPAS